MGRRWLTSQKTRTRNRGLGQEELGARRQHQEGAGASAMEGMSLGARRGMAGNRHTWKKGLEGLVGCSWVANAGF